MLTRSLLVCFLCFLSLSSQSLCLRGSEYYEENELEDEKINNQARTLKPSPKTAASINHLSSDVLAHIFLFLYDPCKQLPLVSKFFKTTSCRFSPVQLAEFRFSSTLDLSGLESKSLANKLLSLDDNFLQNRPEVGCSLGTYLGADLKLVQERTKTFLKGLFDSESDNFGPFLTAIFQSLKVKNVDFLAELIEMVPLEARPFAYSWLQEPLFKKIMYPLYQKNPDLIKKLNQMFTELRLLNGLIAHPVPVPFLLDLKFSASLKYRQNPEEVYYLASQDLAEEKRPEDSALAAELYARNLTLIGICGELQGTARLFQQLFAFFNNFLYNPAFVDVDSAVRAILAIGEEDTHALFRTRHNFASELLLKFFFFNDRVTLFCYVLQQKGFRKANSELAKLVDEHPQFASKLNYTVYSLLSSDVIRLARFRQQKAMEQLAFDNPRITITSQLRLLAKYGTETNYIAYLKNSLLTDQITLLWHLLQDLDHPAPFFCKTLNVFSVYKQLVIGLKINTNPAFWKDGLAPKMFKSLLYCDSEDYSRLRIPLNLELAIALIEDPEIVHMRGSPRYLKILKKVDLDQFHNQNLLLEWSPDRLVKLFQALYFPLSFEYDSLDVFTIGLTQSPSLYFRIHPPIRPIDIIPCLAMNIYSNIDSQPDSAYSKHASLTNPPVYDPLLLASFPLMNLWRLQNWESFFLHAPCFRAFYPMLDETLLTSFYRQFRARPELMIAALLTYPTESFTFSIRSEEDASSLVLDILPLIHEDFHARIKFSIHGGCRDLFIDDRHLVDEPLILSSTEAFISMTRKNESE